MKIPTEEEKMDMLEKYDAFIFDLDGTLWRGPTLLEGVGDLMELLKTQQKKVFFVTNNATKSRASLYIKLTSLWLTVTKDQIYTSALGAVTYLNSKMFSKKIYVVGEEGLVEELKLAGFDVVGGPADNDRTFDWENAGEEPAVEVDPEIGAVVVGLDRNINYYKLQYATTCLLQKEGCEFIACALDNRGTLTGMCEWVGAGTMVGALQAAAGREPVVVGKPSPYMLDSLCETHKVTKDKCLIIGDRLDTDMRWGIENGAGTLLVLTGVTSEKQLKSPENTIHPMWYIPNLGGLLTIKSQLSSSCSLQ